MTTTHKKSGIAAIKSEIDDGWSLQPGDLDDMFSLRNLARLPAPFLGVPIPPARVAEGSHAGPLPLPPIQDLAQGTIPEPMPVAESEPIRAKTESVNSRTKAKAKAKAKARTKAKAGKARYPRATGSESEMAVAEDLFEFTAIDVASSEAWYESVTPGAITPRKPRDSRPREEFTEAERAFFSEGEALATQSSSVEEFVDMADTELSFWQRFWRR